MRQAYVKRAFQGAVFGSEGPCIKGEAARLATKIHRNARDDIRFMLWTLCTQSSFNRSAAITTSLRQGMLWRCIEGSRRSGDSGGPRSKRTHRERRHA